MYSKLSKTKSIALVILSFILSLLLFTQIVSAADNSGKQIFVYGVDQYGNKIEDTLAWAKAHGYIPAGTTIESVLNSDVVEIPPVKYFNDGTHMVLSGDGLQRIGTPNSGGALNSGTGRLEDSFGGSGLACFEQDSGVGQCSNITDTNNGSQVGGNNNSPWALSSYSGKNCKPNDTKCMNDISEKYGRGRPYKEPDKSNIPGGNWTQVGWCNTSGGSVVDSSLFSTTWRKNKSGEPKVDPRINKILATGVYDVKLTFTPIQNAQSYNPITGSNRVNRAEKQEIVVTTELYDYLHRPEVAKYFNGGAVGTEAEWNAIKVRVKSIIQEMNAKYEKGYKSPLLDLNQSAIDSFTRGGAYTITESVRTVNMVGNMTLNDLVFSDCMMIQDYDYKYGPKSDGTGTGILQYDPSKCDKRSGANECLIHTGNRYYKNEYKERVDRGLGKGDYVGITSNDWRVSTSYQILTIRCNNQAAMQLAQQTGSQILYNDGIVLTMKSPIARQQVASYYSGLPSDFFNSDKCAVDGEVTCKVKPGSSRAPSEAQDNKLNTQTGEGDIAELLNEGVLSNAFTFFRDNVEKQVRTNVWYPDTQAQSILERPLSSGTLLLFDPNGTPTSQHMKLTTMSGQDIITDAQPMPSNGRVELEGIQNILNWSSNWAGETDKPHRVSTRFGYILGVRFSVPSKVGAEDILDSVTNDSSMVSYCDSSNSNTNLEPKFLNSEVNGTRVPFEGDFVMDDNNSYRVNFIRSNAE